MPPLVSVIVPCFNARPWVAGAIESALAQDYPAIEVVVVDDGSTDGSADALRPFAARGAITLIAQANRGAAAARNAGIRASRGALIAFLDADDRFLPGAVARRAAYLEAHPEVGAVYAGWLLEDAAGRPRGRPRVLRSVTPADLFVGINPITSSTVLLRRAVLDQAGLFDETLPAVEDLDLWLRVARLTRIGCLDEPVAARREHGGSMTARLGETYFRLGLALTERYVRLDPSLAPLVPARLAQIHRRRALTLLGAFGGDAFRPWAALRALGYPLRHQPLAPATARALLAWLAALVLGPRGAAWLVGTWLRRPGIR